MYILIIIYFNTINTLSKRISWFFFTIINKNINHSSIFYINKNIDILKLVRIY